MNEDLHGPASHAARRHRDARFRTGADRRGYPEWDGADTRDLALAAAQALLHATDPDDVRLVVATVVGDLGGAIVPARFEPEDALELDVALGLAEPSLVVADPASIAAMQLREVLPAVVDGARAVLVRMAGAVPKQAGEAPAPPAALSVYLDRLSAADADGARAFVTSLAGDGVAPASLADQVLAPAQREVGERWYRDQWTVADEHAATAITEGCLAVLPTGAEGPRVVVALPEGEWHALAGRLAATAATGTRARALGPGLPAAQLLRYLESEQPAALALSCTMATNLLSAAASIAAAHAAGVPVVAGGRAFGAGPGRALRLGADGWAVSTSQLADLVPTLTVGAQEAEIPAEAVLADAVPREVLVLALERHAAATPWVAGLGERDRRQSVEDLRWITRHAAAALACDDPTVLDDLMGWLDALLTARGVPSEVLPDGAAYLADALEAETPAVADLVRTCAARLR